MDPLIIIPREQLRLLLEEAVRAVLNEQACRPATAKAGPLTIKEAAAYLNTSVATLYRYTSQRLIPHHKPGKVLYFIQDELDNWLKDHRKLTQAEISTDDNGVLSLFKSKRIRNK
ncbi:helix-turn-helix domain-containing protein [Flavisolibacter nicotianae]|uniref:helix-turn-helix domain-containing protein n=1 Tax=Flavisolibacter nicotianae TaxID=2364882 RepID=UPI000EB3E7C1|nr:helix-turn-helix domain-containing protein [Flavisolibacter nicotianae]